MLKGKQIVVIVVGVVVFVVFAVVAFMLVSKAVPRMVSHQYAARATASRTNLECLRSAVETYYATTGTYPSPSLRELSEALFNNMKKPLLEKIPREFISQDFSTDESLPISNNKIYNTLGTEGGWYYDLQSGRIFVNYNKSLDKEWEKYAGENPSKW